MVVQDARWGFLGKATGCSRGLDTRYPDRNRRARGTNRRRASDHRIVARYDNDSYSGTNRSVCNEKRERKWERENQVLTGASN